MYYRQSNIIKTYVYMALLTGLVGMLAYVVSTWAGYGSTGLGVSLLIAGIINFVGYYFSDKIVLAQSDAQKVTRDVAPSFYAITERLSLSAKLPLPELYVIPDRSLNAFATGRDQDHAAVAVTQGLLDSLEPDELEGVIAHELAHIQNYDMRLMSTVSILVGMLNILTNMVWHTGLLGGSSQRDESRTQALLSILITLITPLVGMLIQLAISRQREYYALERWQIATHSATDERSDAEQLAQVHAANVQALNRKTQQN